MKIVKQSWEWNRIPDGMQILRDIEKAGRTCYKSEDKITEDSAKEFVSKMIKSGHHAMIEFGIVPPVKIITDRGVTHEIVRHRLFSFAQESTRYCNYSKNKFGNEITIIQPVWITDEEMNIYNKIISEKVGNVISLDDIPASLVGSFFWINSMKESEYNYLKLIEKGWSAQQARSVLPNSLKTEINISGNVREWRHFFNLRCSPKAHPQMQDIAKSMLIGFKKDIPVIFDDIIN